MRRDETVERAYREHAVRLLALLAHELSSFDLAEDALQDAHVAALQQWARDGVPVNPAGWLLTVARRRACERLRREATLARKLPLLVTDPLDPAEQQLVQEDVTTIPDERLRLVFTACHPALGPQAQIALTLRFVGGLTTREIARLFLVSEPTMAARLTRAKGKITEAGIPYRVPDDAELPERLTGVLAVVYLIFTEGYAPMNGRRLVRREFCDEAIRLGRLLREMMPDEVEVIALLALMLLQHARRDARVEAGRLVLLPDQDRRRWHAGEIREGLELARRAGRHGRGGAYLLQALIAAEHVAPASAAGTDWNAIAALYEQLEELQPSPVVRLNRAIAVAETEGAAAALSLLDGLSSRLPQSHQLAATRAELLVRLDQADAAVAAYDEALARQTNDVVRQHLTERRDEAARKSSAPGRQADSLSERISREIDLSEVPIPARDPGRRDRASRRRPGGRKQR